MIIMCIFCIENDSHRFHTNSALRFYRMRDAQILKIGPNSFRSKRLGILANLLVSALLSILLGFLVGCSHDFDESARESASESSSKSASESVVVFAGSSMTQALMDIKLALKNTHPEINLELVLAGSQTLAMQINQGAPADIFISANLEQIQRAIGFNTPALLIENTLVGIAPQNTEHPNTSSTQTASIQAVINNATRIVIAHEDVPAGRYTRNALNQLQLWEITKPKIVSYEHTVQGVLSKITLNQADLGFVYKTDALNASDSIKIITLPPHAPTTTQTWISINAASDNKQSPAWTVYSYLTNDPKALEIMLELGFMAPSIEGDTP